VDLPHGDPAALLPACELAPVLGLLPPLGELNAECFPLRATDPVHAHMSLQC
jgi:hypothetical protein